MCVVILVMILDIILFNVYILFALSSGNRTCIISDTIKMFDINRLEIEIVSSIVSSNTFRLPIRLFSFTT
jgi:hypothetical protein